ncbi:MAG TPA: isochorismate synthase, partial [Pseudonocardia sp.]|nr:isochorismate synthase [Pseudonocardia sp.]
MTIAPLPPGLRVRTRPVDDPGGLLDLFPDEHPLCWVRDGEGLVGWGEVARFTASGPDRFAAADAWWRSFAADLEVRDHVGIEGSGPVAFTSFTFADSSPGSVVVVPRVIVGRSEGRAWITEFVGGDGPSVQPVRPVRRTGPLRF